MKRFVVAAVVGSIRRLLAIVIAVLAIAGTAYLGSHKLSNPDHYQYGGCPWYGVVSHGFLRSCSPPTRAAWQIPLAAAIAVFGLGAAAAVTERRRA
jgi:hypothetical protein